MSTETSKKQPSWRAVFGADEVIQRVRPEHTSEYLNNPHKGTTTFQRFNGDPLYPDLRWDDAHGPTKFPPPVHADLSNGKYPATRVSYCRWSWAELEPRKGDLQFQIIDKAIETAAARGQTLQFRTQPFVGGISCPQWYWDTGARIDPESKRSLKVPDHNDPLYITHWSDHIRALGERYDGHPNVESFDIAYGGGCGETGGNATCLTARRLVQVYLDSFPGTQLLSMLGTEGCTYTSRHVASPVGWRADCFGDIHNTGGKGAVPDGLCWNHMQDLYPRELFDCGVTDSWKNAPITFETCWTVPHWLNEGWDIDWILEQGLKYHPTIFMPKSVFIPDAWMDKIMAFSQRLGYWYHLHQMVLPLEAKPGSKVQVAAAIDNRGVAPIYRPYHFALRFSQGHTHRVVKLTQDIRKWMPDLSYFSESFMFPAGLQRGEARISCAIVNASDQPVVRLAIKAIDHEGWHPLTSIDVLE